MRILKKSFNEKKKKKKKKKKNKKNNNLYIICLIRFFNYLIVNKIQNKNIYIGFY